MIHIIDYGLGNIGSIRNMLNRIGVNSSIISTASEVLSAEKLILPGVGSFDSAINKIDSLNLRESICKRSREVPLLGICLGMQLLGDRSEEGSLPGLGLISGTVKRFLSTSEIKIPHMGWSFVTKTKESALTKTLSLESKYYFVHSFHFCLTDQSCEILSCEHGTKFTAALEQRSIFGVQFHPEKSHKFGMKLLENFARI